MDTLVTILQWINDAVIEEYLTKASSSDGSSSVTGVVPTTQRPFEPAKVLRERDEMIVAMLNSAGHEDVSYCVCDPDQTDCPIVFASDGFCLLTGYAASEIEGQNCRFLQGPETSKDDIATIRQAIQQRKEASVNLLNYKKDGTPFNNQFFLLPMYGESSSTLVSDEHKSDNDNDDDDKKLQYFIGIQCSVEKLGPAQHPKNCGWVYTSGLHA